MDYYVPDLAHLNVIATVIKFNYVVTEDTMQNFEGLTNCVHLCDANAVLQPFRAEHFL